MSPVTIRRQMRPEDIFGPEPDGVTGIYKHLAREFHPDRPGGDLAIMALVNSLYDEARERIRLNVYGC